jgi:hypothetical protein
VEVVITQSKIMLQQVSNQVASKGVDMKIEMLQSTRARSPLQKRKKTEINVANHNLGGYTKHQMMGRLRLLTGGKLTTCLLTHRLAYC